ncbi:MAG: anti-sigma factor [Rubrivivax sp.]|nr:anti-sigma factor [Rubrivivax sp.]
MTDEELSAWVDGELPEAERPRIEAWLRAHPEDAARARRWADDRDALRARLGPIADEPVPALLRATVWRGAGLPRWAMAASAAGLLLLGGLAGGGAVWQWQRYPVQVVATAPQGWVQRAAFAHAVYAPEPRHAVEVKAQEEHLARWLTRRIETPVKLFDLRAQGFELVGGRLLPDGPGKSAQLMYQDAQGLRVTVYLRKPEKDVDAAFRFERQGELGLFYWIEEGCAYALVGALPRETLLALAQAIYQQREVAPPAGTAAGPR